VHPAARLLRIRLSGRHTRFAHSIGVLHIARLLQVIRQHLGPLYYSHRAEVALAAARAYDVGHGKFSHAFEEIGRRLNDIRTHLTERRPI
jgi:HD superfamily phosphohydrolase